MIDRNELLRQIAQCEFTLIDINLYLDTHPNCSRALADYKCYSEQLAALKNLYDRKYGTIQNFGNSDVSNAESWNWVESNFPWNEMGMED